MTCCYCKAHAKKSGKFKTANGHVQRYRCLSCGKTFKAEGPLGDMRISEEKAAQILNLLVEGVGINAASRLTGVHKETVSESLRWQGSAVSASLTRRSASSRSIRSRPTRFGHSSTASRRTCGEAKMIAPSEISTHGSLSTRNPSSSFLISSVSDPV